MVIGARSGGLVGFVRLHSEMFMSVGSGASGVKIDISCPASTSRKNCCNLSVLRPAHKLYVSLARVLLDANSCWRATVQEMT